MSFSNLTRRGVIKTGAAAGAGLALPTYLSAAAHSGFTNAPTGDTVTLGFNVPQSGPYADEGADELRAFELAVEHLNGQGDGGMLNTFSSKALEGNGIMGKKVQFVTGDTQTKSDAARASAQSMIQKDGAIMISGGSSSGVAVAVQGLCQEAGVIFMSGLTHSNDTTGKDKKANGFRHFFNAYMSAAALAPVLKNLYGDDRKVYSLTADYTWGWTQQESIQAATEAMGWETINDVRTPLAATDFSSYIAPVLNSGADVLVLNHYGGNMVNSLTNAVQFGLREKQVNGKNFEIVVPLYSELMARGAGENITGIVGSQNWDWKLENQMGDRYKGTNAFVQSFGEKYGFPPARRLRPAMRRRCCMRMPWPVPVRSTPAPSAKPLPGSNSTVWATARRCTAPMTTSASRTLWSCAAKRTPRMNSISWKSSKSPQPIRSPMHLTTRCLRAASWATATPARKPSLRQG